MRTIKVIAYSHGRLWRLREGTRGAESVHGDLESALQTAEQELTRSPGGGTIEVHHLDGRIERRTVPQPDARPPDALGLLQPPSAHPQANAPAPPPPPAEGLRETLGQVRREKKRADQAVKYFFEMIWPVLLTLFGSAISGAITPEVAAQRSFSGVFWATLAWSSGIALLTFFLIEKPFEAGPVQYSMLAVGCLYAGSLIAVGVGHGEYGVTIEWGRYGSTPFAWPLPPVAAAIDTFGWAGALIGGLCGALAGRWAARLWKKAAG
ncbi:hypothetical protein [Streptomyces alboflavus]|uniref:hypothetical protein n=1 Tax=Streptomyces alboflavus TaxID=67267 RepID=UPI000F658EFE|nr:hypothetical protein [Streptomyces alboflavus]